MAGGRQWIILCAMFSLTWPQGSGERVLGEETDEFDFDGLPGAQHEFKIEIKPGHIECFYQKIVQGGKIHVSFEVIEGGDRKICTLIRQYDNPRGMIYDAIYDRPDGVLMHEAERTVLEGTLFIHLCKIGRTYLALGVVVKGGDGLSTLYLMQDIYGQFSILKETEYLPRGGFQYGPFNVLDGGDRSLDFSIRHPRNMTAIQQVSSHSRWITEFSPDVTGPYAICLDNSRSVMASKLVYVYLVTYVEEEWTKYRQEIEDVQLTVTNFTETIESVKGHIRDSMLHVAQGRMHVIKDWYLINNNRNYVQWWSIAQCVVIVISSVTQVFVLRRLFRTPKVTPTSKPRA